jgi:acyl-CoA synthetase (AMP-forming)/AMP-acid ligase II
MGSGDASMFNQMTSQGFYKIEIPDELNMARLCTDWWVEQGGRADDVAIYHLDQKITYRELKQQTDAFGTGVYQMLGMRKGERYVIRTPNCPEYMIAFLGGQKIGAVPVPTNPMLREYELTHIINNSESVAVVTTPELVQNIENIRSKCPTLKHIIVIGEVQKDYFSYAELLSQAKVCRHLCDPQGRPCVLSLHLRDDRRAEGCGARSSLHHRCW